MGRSRRSEKLDGFPDFGEGSWPGGSRGATRGEILGGPERSPPGEGGGGAAGGPDASIDRIDLSRRNDWKRRRGGGVGRRERPEQVGHASFSSRAHWFCAWKL